MDKKILSLVVPVYNEEQNILALHDAVMKVFEASLSDRFEVEMIFVDDGSTDGSMDVLLALSGRDPRVRYIEFSRNFGKEVATSAGIHASRGAACIMMDADLQHPPELLPEFVRRWEEDGLEVLIGVRKSSKSDRLVKRWGGKIFYRIMRSISDVPIVTHATDYRLLDRRVVDAFNRLPERSRITRGLVDWLGFRRGIIRFEAAERQNGTPGYTVYKLVRLAVTSVISLSMLPLRVAGYLGVFIVLVSTVLGIVMMLDRWFVPSWDLNFSGPAILANVNLFLVGVVLVSIGLLAFYVEHIYRETQGRPLYVVRRASDDADL